MLKIQIITASIRDGRAGENITNWVKQNLPENKDVEFEFIDLKDLSVPHFNDSVPPSTAQGNYQSEFAKTWAKRINAADGYLIITPEYNHGYPGVLKDTFDWAYKEWNNKPIGFVSYGSAAGGARSVEQLRLVAIELQMAPIREAVVISNYWAFFDDKGELTDENLREKLHSTINQLLWWADALKSDRLK